VAHRLNVINSVQRNHKIKLPNAICFITVPHSHTQSISFTLDEKTQNQMQWWCHIWLVTKLTKYVTAVQIFLFIKSFSCN